MRIKLLAVLLVFVLVLATGCMDSKSVETQTEAPEQHIKIDFPDDGSKDLEKESKEAKDSDDSEDVSERESKAVKDSEVSSGTTSEKDKTDSNKGSSDKGGQTSIPGLEDSIFDEDSDDYAGLQEPDGPKDDGKPSGGQQGGSGTGSGSGSGSESGSGSGTGQGSDQGSAGQQGSSTQTPSQGSGDNSGSGDAGEMDYESFQAMSPKGQQEYMATFDDMDAFFDWYNAAKDKYEAENPPIEIDGGSVNLDEIINGK